MTDKKHDFHYGGQAIIEGVMMRGPKDFAIAVRRADGEIVSVTENVESMFAKLRWLKKPFLRGTLALIDAMALGIKALKYSADIAMRDIAASESGDQAGSGDEPHGTVKGECCVHRSNAGCVVFLKGSTPGERQV